MTSFSDTEMVGTGAPDRLIVLTNHHGSGGYSSYVQVGMILSASFEFRRESLAMQMLSAS